MLTFKVKHNDGGEEVITDKVHMRMLFGYGVHVRLLVDGPHGAAGTELGLSTSVALDLLEAGHAEYIGKHQQI